MKVQVTYQKLNTDTGEYEDVKAFDEVRSVKVETRHDAVKNVMHVIIRDTQEYV